MFNILFNPKEAEKHYLRMMFVGIFYSSLSLLVSFWIFPSYASLTMVFFTLISCLYVVQGAFKSEEDSELDYKSETWTLIKHIKILHLLLFLFLGFVISFSFWAAVLPVEKVSILFDLQASVVDGIKSLAITGDSVGKGTLFIILENNFKVLLISLILAIFYGAGAIFVLTWNASVMGLVIGNLAKKTLGVVALPIAFTKYFVHGIFEMLAYIVIALAGGIIYVAIARGDFIEKGKRKRIIIDAIILTLISVFLLILAALIEVYISPFI